MNHIDHLPPFGAHPTRRSILAALGAAALPSARAPRAFRTGR